MLWLKYKYIYIRAVAAIYVYVCAPCIAALYTYIATKLQPIQLHLTFCFLPYTGNHTRTCSTGN